jgi:hypothetical protein
MANGITNERKMQFSWEGTPGTIEAARVIWRGPANSIEDQRSTYNPDENVGYAVELPRPYTPTVSASYSMPDSEVTFEQGPYIANACIAALVTGVADGGTSGAKIYAFPHAATAAAHTHKTFTIEAGNNNLSHVMEYAFVDKWGISGTSSDAKGLMWKGVHWTGRQRAAQAFTGALTPVLPEPVLFRKGKLYLDDATGTLGATQKTLTWLAMELNGDPGLEAVGTGDGDLFWSYVQYKGAKITGSITVIDDATANGLETDWVANTNKLLRMQFAGSATSGTGGTYTTKLLRLDQSIWINKVNTLSSSNGKDTKKVDFTCAYNITKTLMMTMTFVNALATLT